MNRLLLFIFLLFLTNCISSQIKDSVSISYFNERGRLTFEESSFYYRQSTDTINYFRSFYSNSKNKYFEGAIVNAHDTSDYDNLYKGLCTWYYPNGNLKIQCEYNNIGVLNGVKKEFDVNGVLIKLTHYTSGIIKDKKHIEFDNNGSEIDVFEEDFKDNTMNWVVESNEQMSSKLKTGGLELSNKSNKNNFVFCNKEIDSLNYSIEVKINSYYLSENVKSGIIFGFKDFNNYSYFYISKYKLFVGKIVNGIDSVMLDDFFSFELNGQFWNKIKIQVLNDSIYYLINNKIHIIDINTIFKEKKIALNVTVGAALFDDFLIKQYAKKTKVFVAENRMYYKLRQSILPINQVNSGVVLGRGGYILTSIKNINKVNRFFVEVNVEGVIKVCDADLFYNNDIYKYAILKIRDTTHLRYFNLEYNYSYIKNSSTVDKTVIYEYEKDSINGNIEFIKHVATNKEITDHKHGRNGNFNYHTCIGAPIFDLSGNILGVINDVNSENEFKFSPIQQIIGTWFSTKGVLDLKNKPNFNVSEFYNNIYKNVVIVKTL